MADTKIKDLTLKSTPDTTDEFVINDVMGANVDKKVTLQGILSKIQSSAPHFWQELGKTTLGVAADTITVSGLTARKNLIIIIHVRYSGSVSLDLRFNNDSGTNYTTRDNFNGAADVTTINQAQIALAGAQSWVHMHGEFIVMNHAADVKIFQGEKTFIQAAGSGTAPSRGDVISVWNNTVDQITRVDVINTGTGSFDTDSEVIVLGAD